MTAARSAPVHMAVAFLAMGGWAMVANAGHPMPKPLYAGLVQGCLSAVITLGLKLMVEAMVRRLAGVAALLVPPVAAALCSIAILGTIHHLAGTPEIARTLALPATVTTLYAAALAFTLRRRGHG